MGLTLTYLAGGPNDSTITPMMHKPLANALSHTVLPEHLAPWFPYLHSSSCSLSPDPPEYHAELGHSATA